MFICVALQSNRENNAQCVSTPTTMLLSTAAGTSQDLNCFAHVIYKLQTYMYQIIAEFLTYLSTLLVFGIRLYILQGKVYINFWLHYVVNIEFYCLVIIVVGDPFCKELISFFLSLSLFKEGIKSCFIFFTPLFI